MIALMQQRKIRINFSQAKINFCLSLHFNGGNSYLYISKTESFQFKRHDDMSSMSFV